MKGEVIVKPGLSVDIDVIIDTKAFKEDIGYFSASMPGYREDAIFKLSHFMRGHGVHMQKSNENPADDWWVVFPASTRQYQDSQRTE